MTPRRETCRWVLEIHRAKRAQLWQRTECGRFQYGRSSARWSYCPHCGGRIVREEGK